MSEASIRRDALLAENARLWAENATLRATVTTLEAQVATLTERLAVLEQRPPSAGFKANRPTPAGPQPARKRRDVTYARRREPATHTVTHAVERCPDCGRALTGGVVANERQIIAVPLVPVTITDHVTLTRSCPVCQTAHTPVVDLSAQVLGKHRLGLQTMALLVVLREFARLPLRQIQRLLALLWGLELSVGEIVAVQQLAAVRGTVAAEAILGAIRASPVVHMDETGWRENGQNGYLWSASTPRLRYFRRGSRQKSMVDDLLGAQFSGTLVTDFYAAYDHYPGPHQRCWTHLLRDLHELIRTHPTDAGPAAGLGEGEQASWRRARQRRYETALVRLCQRYVGQPVPQRVLCARVLKYLPELFSFVANPRVPADNNAAERSIRPLAVARKISGGTRSAAGSLTRSVLWTLTATWQAQGKHLLAAWTALLRDPTTSAV